MTGHVEVVAHGGPADPARSTVLTGLRIVEDDDGARTAIITGMALERTESGWRETKFTLIAVDGGRGRDLDSVEVIGHPVPCEGTFRGQVVVHR